MSQRREGLGVTGGHVRFGTRPGLSDFTLHVSRGERVALLGPSGVGKTSLLRAIAGLGGLTAGQVTVDGQDVTDLQPERRGIVYVHQTPALFPHLSVLENVAFPLEVRGTPRDMARTRARAMLDRVQLGPLAHRPSTTLSGGQRHRAALARALSADPCALLLDEPFASLDPGLRADVREAVLSLLGENTGPAVLLVTHDIDEAAGLADRLVVLLDGRIAQVGAPSDLLGGPRTLAVAKFLGLTNLLRGTRDDGGTVTCALGAFQSAGRAGPVTVTLRTAGVRARAPRGDGARGTIAGVVERVSGLVVRVRIDGDELIAVPERELALTIGGVIDLVVDPFSVHVVDGQTGTL